MKTESDAGRLAGELAGVLLHDSAILTIDFYIGRRERLHVTGWGLGEVGALIRSGHIKLVVDDARLDKAHAGAQYDYALNTIFVPSDWTRTTKQREQAKVDEQKSIEAAQKYSTEKAISASTDPGVFRGEARQRASLVHEATHALLDLRGFKVFAARNEAAAFLAMMVYLFHRKELEGVVYSVFGVPSDLEKHADEVARKNHLYTQPGVRLARGDLQPLLRSVIAHYGASSLRRTPADGID